MAVYTDEKLSQEEIDKLRPYAMDPVPRWLEAVCHTCGHGGPRLDPLWARARRLHKGLTRNRTSFMTDVAYPRLTRFELGMARLRPIEEAALAAYLSD